MAKAISRYITAKLLTCGLISEEDKELYEYAAIIMCYLCTPFILVALLSPLTGLLYEGFVMVIPFTLLRRYCGGFHFKSNKVCLAISFIYLMAMEKIGSAIGISSMLLIVGLVSLLILFFIAISKTQKCFPMDASARNKSVYIIFLVIVLSVIFLLIKNKGTLAKWIVIGIVMTLNLQLPLFIYWIHIKCKLLAHRFV